MRISEKYGRAGNNVAPLLTNNSLTVHFERNPNVRKLVFEIEDKAKELGAHFMQPNPIPIPDDMDPAAPRIIFEAIHGFAQIVIAQNHIALNTRYSDDYKTNTGKCQAYIEKHASILYDIITSTIKSPIFFTGLSSVANILFQASDEDIMKLIQRHYHLDTAGLFDIDIKTTKVINETYFNNLRVQNGRMIDSNPPSPEIKPVSISTVTTRGIQLQFDFNDRYSFNENKGHQASKEKCRDLICKGFDVLNDELNKFSD
jgi:hypothetical protein